MFRIKEMSLAVLDLEDVFVKVAEGSDIDVCTSQVRNLSVSGVENETSGVKITH